MRSLLFSILCVLLLLGCKATTITQAQLAGEIDAVYANTMHRGVFYVGSDAEFHFFVTKWELKKDRLLQVPTGGLSMPSTYAPTKDEALWLPMGSFEYQQCSSCEQVFIYGGKRYFVGESGS